MIDRQLSPCIYTCPINLNARDYIGLIAEGRFFEALDLMRDKLPFPGIIGRICAHPCENACLRGKEVDQPIAICALKRFLADYEIGQPGPLLAGIAPEKDKKAAVIGAGPFRSLHVRSNYARQGYQCNDIRCRMTNPEGMLYAGIPAYRLPRDVLAREFFDRRTNGH